METRLTVNSLSFDGSNTMAALFLIVLSNHFEHYEEAFLVFLLKLKHQTFKECTSKERVLRRGSQCLVPPVLLAFSKYEYHKYY